MLDMLRQTGRPEMVVGWYHSHPGFGCWLSGVDINTQQSFEALSERAVAVVVDPIQSVKGKLLKIVVHLSCVQVAKIFTCVFIVLNRQSGYRRVPTDQSKHDGFGTRTQADNLKFGASSEAINPGFDSWFKPALLFYQYQLQEERIRTEDAFELAQEILG